MKVFPPSSQLFFSIRARSSASIMSAMVPWWFFVVIVVSQVNSEPEPKEAAKVEDAEVAGTDFFPQYNGFPSFQFQSPAVLPPQDLTALQQTHVLGDFAQRIQQHRFGANQFQNQQVLFSQKTDFGQPQQQNNGFINAGLPQHVLPPPQEQPPALPFIPQPQPQQPTPFRPLPPPSPPTLQNTPVFNSQLPQFPERQQQFVDNRNPQFSDQQRQVPQTFSNFRSPTHNQQFQNQQSQPSFQGAAFRTQQTFIPQTPRNAPPNFSNLESQQSQDPRSNLQVQNKPFSNEPNNAGFRERNPQFVEQQRSPNSQFVEQRNPQILSNPAFPSQFGNNQPAPEFNKQFPINAPNNFQNFQNNVQIPQQQPQSQPQPSFVFPGPQQNGPQRVANQFVQNNQASFEAPLLPLNPSNTQNFHQTFPPSKPSESQINLNPNKKSTFSSSPQFGSSEETTQYNLNVVHTRGPQHPTAPEKPSEGRPLLPITLPPEYSPEITAPTGQQEYVFQKSQEQNYFKQGVSIDSQATLNELSPSSPRYAPTTPAPVKIRKPKPEVKEITINLGTTSAPSSSLKRERTKVTKKEKTQEDLINEQIQKLLQSHNLELVGKETKNEPTPTLPELPDDLKDKVKIQLVNPDLLSTIKGGKKKKEKLLEDSTPVLPPLPELPDHIKKQYDIKLVQKDELFKQFKIGAGGKITANSDLVAPLPGNVPSGNSTVFLANGQQLQILNLPDSVDKNSIILPTPATTGKTTTAKTPKVLFEELAKGVIPPGADFELIKHGPDGQVEKVNDLAAAKKVTFVILEEQPDGSVKVQGVKGNVNHENNEKDSVDSLIKKIKDGSLKLPPSNNIQNNHILGESTTDRKTYVTISPFTEREFEYSTQYYTTPPPESTYNSVVTESLFVTTTNEYSDPSTFYPTIPSYSTTSKKPKSKSRPSFLPTPTYNNIESSTAPPKRHKSKRPLRRKPTTTTTTTTEYYDYEEDDDNHRSSNYNGEGPVPQDVIGQESSPQPSRSLTLILQDNGLNEMAKFLSQSGLDSILNETGPYTIFIPTDEAFANLQDQLGGMDKAEDKFRENPRLLSGLLLHHVVPGAFKISDLQDEMTGVSLAGTQLRVNTYNSDKKDSSLTINGALVSETQRDIAVPQGLAHAVHRVLFPLPVGDLLQTLKGDRERRFTKFVKSIEASGLSDLLTGSKTYTLFAPTDRAFSALTDAELDKLLTKREAARTIVLRHVMPGTLYSAGMHYYQIKDSMEKGQKITIEKELGNIKVNSAHVIASNIPTTNGVIHVLENLL